MTDNPKPRLLSCAEIDALARKRYYAGPDLVSVPQYELDALRRMARAIALADERGWGMGPVTGEERVRWCMHDDRQPAEGPTFVEAIENAEAADRAAGEKP